MEDRKAQVKADVMLMLVTLGWGVSYFMMDLCLEEIDPLTLNAFRFLGAFAVAWIISAKKAIHVSRMTLKYAFLVSLVLVVVYLRRKVHITVKRRIPVLYRCDFYTNSYVFHKKGRS